MFLQRSVSSRLTQPQSHQPVNNLYGQDSSMILLGNHTSYICLQYTRECRGFFQCHNYFGETFSWAKGTSTSSWSARTTEHVEWSSFKPVTQRFIASHYTKINRKKQNTNRKPIENQQKTNKTPLKIQQETLPGPEKTSNKKKQRGFGRQQSPDASESGAG